MEQDRKFNNLPSTGALAYLGDARHSLYVRELLVRRGLSHSGDLNRASLSFVTAESQAKMVEKILPILTESETRVYRSASNSKHLNKPKGRSGRDYRAATGFEAVIGMLYLVGEEERLAYLLEICHKDLNEKLYGTENGDIKIDTED